MTLQGFSVSEAQSGAVSHPPPGHPEEELLIAKEGTVETLQNGTSTRLGPGSMLLFDEDQVTDLVMSLVVPSL